MNIEWMDNYCKDCVFCVMGNCRKNPPTTLMDEEGFTSVYPRVNDPDMVSRLACSHFVDRKTMVKKE